MATTDNKVAKGTEIEGLLTLVATEMRKGAIPETVAKAFCDLAYRVQALESIVSENNLGTRTADEIDAASLKVGGVDVKTKQTAKSSPSASSTAIAFIDTLSQDTNGVVTATKKTVRTGSTSQTGVVQLAGSIGATVSSENNKAASEKAVRDAINALDVSSVGGDGKFISAISETDGKISATATTMDTTPTASSTNAVTSGGVESSLALKENTANKISFIRGLSEADHTRFPTEYATRLAIESTRSLIEKYLRVHCEGILGVQGWTSINLYSYDSNTPVINTPSGLGDNNFRTILYKEIDASHTWDPCSKGCEDFLVIKQGHQAELTTYFQLGPIFELPQVRRFKMRLYNNESYRWTVSICHTRTNAGEYAGDIIFSTNKSGRYESNLDIIIEPKRCITIEVLISTSYYNDLNIPVVFVSTNEEIAS